MSIMYLVSISANKQIFLLVCPLQITSFLFICMELKKLLNNKPDIPVLSNKFIKPHLDRLSTVEFQIHGRHRKNDIEIYVGIYLLACVVFGDATIVSTCLYWHMIRVRYMMSN